MNKVVFRMKFTVVLLIALVASSCDKNVADCNTSTLINKDDISLSIPKCFFIEKKQTKSSYHNERNNLFIGLWYRYPSMETLKDNKGVFLKKRPNDVLKIFITKQINEINSGDWNFSREMNNYQERLGQLTLVNSRLNEKVLHYRRPLDDRYDLYKFNDDSGVTVFISCHRAVSSVCRANKTINNMSIQYHFFHDVLIEDIINVDKSVNNMIHTFLNK